MIKNNYSIKIYGYILIFFGIFCSNLIEAFPIVLKRDTTTNTTNNDDSNNDGPDGKETLRKIIAGVAVVVGFFTCFLGHKLYRTVIFYVGFFAGSFLMRSILTSLKSDINGIILYVCTYITGFICGTLAVYVYKFSLCILGVLAGCCINGIIISFFPIVGEKINPIIIISVFSIIFIILIFKYEISIIIISTGIAGSFMMIYCIDIIIDSGLSRSLQSMYDNSKFKNTNSNIRIRLLDIVAVIVAIIGWIVQFIYYSHHKNICAY